MLKRLVFCFVALAMSLGASAGAWAKDRYALVIGNSKYQATMALPNPVRDAGAVAELLDSAGFEVTSALDLGQSGMRRAVRVLPRHVERQAQSGAREVGGRLAQGFAVIFAAPGL